MSAGTRLRLFLQGDLWNQSDCENDRLPKAALVCWASNAPSVLRSALFPCASKEKRIYLDYMRAVQPVLWEDVCRVFIFLHKTLWSRYLYLVFSYGTILLVEIPSQILCICGTEEIAGSSIGCALWWNGISGRFQGFSSAGAMFWIRHHPTVSFFNYIPPNWEWAFRFLFCFCT